MGAALSKTGLDRRTPLATATLVVAANAPDVDVLSYTQGEYFALAFRRGLTHGVPAQLLLPFLVAGGMLAWDRWVRRRRDPQARAAVPREILLLSLLGVLTHPALDWMNVYGMRWWLPLSPAWTYGDALFIIDPWLWIVLGGAVALSGAGAWGLWLILGTLTTLLMMVGPVPAAASALWAAGILLVTFLRWKGWPDSRRGAERLARASLATATAYIVLMMVADVVGSRAVLRAAAEAGIEATEVMLSPSAANPFVAEVEVVTPTGYVPGEHRWLPRPRVSLFPGEAVPRVGAPEGMDEAAVQAVLARARAQPDVRHYLVWSRYPYVVLRPDGEGWRVRYADARYDDREGAGGLSGVDVRVPGTP